jgi:hypothetical protein
MGMRERGTIAPWLMGIAAALLMAMGGGCGSVAPEVPDAPPAADARPVADAPAAADAQVPDASGPTTAPAVTAQTAGGGAASSASYNLQVRFGAPQPMGRTSSASYRVSLGRSSP